MKSLRLIGLIALVPFCSWGADNPNVGEASLSRSVSTQTNTANELHSLETADDVAQAEVESWVRQNNEAKAKGAGISQAELDKRIEQRLEPVRKGYEDFIQRYPGNARAHLVLGNFLNDRQDEPGAQLQWEKALELDPKNPEVYNNLAGRYTETGPVNKVFEYFAKAIELSPDQGNFYHNFGDSLYVLRQRAAPYYGITEQQVFARVLLLYSNAVRLEPKNYAFARDLAQTYYSVKPFPTDEALQAWTNALTTAQEESDREDVYVHLARVKMLAGHFAEARAQLGAVTNESCLKAKTSLLQNLEQR
ncbi:MAG TPA: hypothetical protein VL793_09705, partial [Patescibacteria group bacterium]|nr:hypothetical protein [Patescibacteria group bacterium]